MSEENLGKPEGKGMAIGGFVLGLVGLIFANLIFGINFASMTAAALTGEEGGKGLMIFWVILCLIGVLLSVMGMMKLGKTGGKKGLAIAGMIIGIVAVVWSIVLLMGLSVVGSGINEVDGNLQDMMNDAQDALNDL